MKGRLGSSAVFADSMDGEVRSCDPGAFGEVPELGGVEIGRRVGVDDFAAGLAVEMDVLVEVRAVAGLAALEVDLLDEAVGGEVVEAVIDRGQGDVRGARFDPVEDVVGRGVVRGASEDVEDLATVRREAHIGPEDGHAAFEAGGLRRGTGGGDGGWHDELSFRIGMILRQAGRCAEAGGDRTDPSDRTDHSASDILRRADLRAWRVQMTG